MKTFGIISMLFFVAAFAVTAFGISSDHQQIIQEVRAGHHQATIIEDVPAAAQGMDSRTVNPSRLTTSVQDPAHPGEPWVIVTYQRAGESNAAFIRRHRDLVAAVREALL